MKFAYRNTKLIKYLSVSMFVFILAVSISVGQNAAQIEDFHRFAKEMNFTFSIPEGYSRLDSTDRFSHGCQGSKTMGSTICELQNKDKSIVIGIRLMSWVDHDTTEANNLIRRRNPMVGGL